MQYWLYYPFNDFTNKHESDWEMIQVEFAASDAATALTQEPTRVGYSQHEGVELAQWGDVKLEVVDGTHPVVHPAAGSHANYYDAALFLGRSGQQGFGCDDTRSPGSDLRPAVALVPSDASAVGAAYPWLDYTGRWGQRETSFYNGPTGPNTKDQWTGPLTWTDDRGRRHRVRRARQRAVRHPGDERLLRHRHHRLGGAAGGHEQPRLGRPRPGGALGRGRLARAPHHVVARPPRCGWRAGGAPARSSRAVWRMYLGRVLLFVGHRRSRSPSRPCCPGVATVWMTSAAESLGGNQTLYGRRRRRRPAWCSWRWRRSTLSVGRGRRDGRGPRDRRGPPGRRPQRLRAVRCGAPCRCCSPRRRSSSSWSCARSPSSSSRVALVGLVLSLLVTPVVLFEDRSGLGRGQAQCAPGAAALGQGGRPRRA